MIPMTPESKAFLDALVPSEGAVSTDHTDAVYDLLVPIHKVLADTEAHFQAIDALRIAADRAEENPQVYGWFERFKQSIDAGRRLNADAKRAVEAISDLCFQLDTYAREMREVLSRTVEPPRRHVVNLNAEEWKAAQETIKEQDKQLQAALKELNALKEKK